MHNIILIYEYFKMNSKYFMLGIGDWGLGPIPNPQSPIPKPHYLIIKHFKLIII